jgi:dTDP-4-dehydrorhamnose 3,5-epimerase
MRVETFSVLGVMLLTPVRHRDGRGFFSETYNQRSLSRAGISESFVQDNHSLSVQRGVVRGLHFQVPPHAQGKLVRVSRGAILDVAVDIRCGSPTFGHHVAVELSAVNWQQLWVPKGFAHGFCTLEPDTEVLYKVTDYYAPDCDKGIAWSDPSLKLDWPVTLEDAIVSTKDASLPRLVDLPVYFNY